jgi:foldase protein PrsA
VDSIVRRRSLIVPIAIIIILLIVTIAIFLAVSNQRRSDLLATVNAEPIYAADIEQTIKLLPPQYRTTQNRESFLNQTIDLLLLKQEATRRGITVSQHDIDTRVETILNDTARSPQELRVLLGDQNLSLEEYRGLIADSLLVEKLTTEVVTNRITVSEQEILTYYQAHQNEFVPPKSGARISHILVANETTARTVVSLLDHGVGFRELVQNYSIDTGSRSSGGSLGVVTVADSYPSEFLSASLALTQNQYTRVPVKTSWGYHIILRNFDVPDVQEARSSIQQKLLGQKQRDGFTALLTGLHASAKITYYTASGVVTAPTMVSIESFSACVGKRAVLYGEPWSTSFTEQRALFGSAASLLTTVDCASAKDKCSVAGVTKYPTWIIDGKQQGQLTLAELSSVTGCVLPA